MAEQPRFCGSCGKALTEGRPFCGFCGASNAVTASSLNSVDQGLAPRGSRKTVVLGVVGVLALIVVGSALYFATARSSAGTAPNPVATAPNPVATATDPVATAANKENANTADWGPLVDGLENSVRWQKGVDTRVSAPIKFLSLPNPVELVVTGGGTVQLRYQGGIVNISSPQATAHSDGPVPYVQCGTYDFDGGGDPKVIVAWGDDSVNLGVKLFEYVGGNAGNAALASSWQIVGDIDGQQNVSIHSFVGEKSKIIDAPFGSQGLYVSYGWRAGRLVEINPH